MYADSMVGGDQNVVELEQSKIFEKSGMVIGVAGAVTVLNHLRHGYLPEPPDDLDGEQADAWVTRVLTPAIRAVVEETGIQQDQQGLYGFGLLVIVAGRCYEISSDFGWARTRNGIYTIGTGDNIALGALAAGASPREAVRIAAQYDPYTGHSITKKIVLL